MNDVCGGVGDMHKHEISIHKERILELNKVWKILYFL